MKSSFRIGRLLGIDVHVHITFFLLLAWLAYSYYGQRQDFGDVLRGIGLSIALFMIVVLHELGHAMAARYFGIRTLDITLLPIGGVARLERMPDDPKQELVVALAGPAVNVVLAILIYGLILLGVLGEGLPRLDNVVDASMPFLVHLLMANVFMVLFNLLPAFPMDGGRVLRSLLAMWLDYVKATQIAATIGKVMAFLFAAAALVFAMPMLFLIALFVWMGAGAEANYARQRTGFVGVPVSRAMFTDFQSFAPFQTLGEALPWVLSTPQTDFPIEEGDRLVGLVSRDDILRAASQGATEHRLNEVMQRNFPIARPQETLETVFLRMRQLQRPALPVVENGELLGMVTVESVGQLVMNNRRQAGLM